MSKLKGINRVKKGGRSQKNHLLGFTKNIFHCKDMFLFNTCSFLNTWLSSAQTTKSICQKQGLQLPKRKRRGTRSGLNPTNLNPIHHQPTHAIIRTTSTIDNVADVVEGVTPSCIRVFLHSCILVYLDFFAGSFIFDYAIYDWRYISCFC